MGQQVVKVRLTDETVRDCKANVVTTLLAEGFTEFEARSIAGAVGHLAWMNGPDLHVEINIERTPSHYQVTVALL